MSESEKAAQELAAECMRRISAAAHSNGKHVHLVNPRTGRVCCFEAGKEPPEGEGWVYSGRQEALWAAQQRREGG